MRFDQRTSFVAAGLLALATAISWYALVRYPMSMGLAGFLIGWTLMMTAMMLPSIAPLVMLYRGSRVTLTIGYLLVWGVLGLIPYAAMTWTMTIEKRRAAIVLALAGVYELTPLKTACLRHCQNPATFLMQHYKSGAWRLGVEHALWCTGCCIGLMAVLVFAAAMHLFWAAVIAAVVVLQKTLPLGLVSARVMAVALIVAAVVVAL